ncbi:MAG TPA: GTPase ObgE [Candidatus Udaeobacter sp.]|nr:GTPase ObgE [Candidatus Udaeobacter sp.]
MGSSDRRRFIDSARIHVRAGHGGRGSASFRHEPFVPRGGPDGGDGGRGGSVILEATNDVTDLSEYRRRSAWHAEPGADGAGGRKTGRNGEDRTLKVPVGTLAVGPDGAVVADLDQPGATKVVARGGAGGRGNVHFKSSTRQAPDYAEHGLKGEELDLVLDLKLIADVGLVGPPNAGKSSLLRALTAARPKVGDYPFTTLIPQLGVAGTEAGPVVIADIPGLIEGAAQGAGLGQRFLRHVERTKVLVYLLDGAAHDPFKDLETISKEVAQFAAGLAARPHVVAVNKVDLDAVRRLRARTRRKDVHFVSALTGEGLSELMSAVVKLLAAAPAPVIQVAPRVTKLRVRGAEAMSVERKSFGFQVRGERVEQLLERTNMDSDSGLARFQSALDRLGVNAALEAAGVEPGDTVRIGSVEFEYQP